MKAFDENDPARYTKKYTIQQYRLAELMLTHEGFTIAAIARVCRLSQQMVIKLAQGELTFRVAPYDEDNE